MDKITLNIDALFLQHRQTLIHTIARIVGCPQTAEDLAQDTYLKMRTASATQEICYPSPFMFQIGRNLALDHLRKQQIRQTADYVFEECEDHGAILDRLPSDAPSLERVAAGQQEAALLWAAMQNLPERRRQILVLHKLHHWTYERIAAHYGISRSAVEKNLKTALSALMAEQDGESPL